MNIVVGQFDRNCVKVQYICDDGSGKSIIPNFSIGKLLWSEFLSTHDCYGPATAHLSSFLSHEASLAMHDGARDPW